MRISILPLGAQAIDERRGLPLAILVLEELRELRPHVVEWHGTRPSACRPP
jgi:hypothetical protein